MGRRITLVVPSLSTGGAERVAAQTANLWTTRGDQVTVVTLSSAANDTYPLDPRVTRVALDVMSNSRGLVSATVANGRRLRALRRAILGSSPDVVVSFVDRMNVLTLLASVGTGLRVVISERIDLSRHDIGRAWSLLRRMTYPHADAIVVQTQRVAAKLRGLMRGCPVHIIANAVQPVGGEWHAPNPDGSRLIAAMGRLDRQKGFDLLVEAFSRIASRHPLWSLRVFGEGHERLALERLIVDRDLAGRVELAGWQAGSGAALRACDMFVLSSRYEGFPNALLDAMSAGLPVVSFNCDSGPAEIIRDGVDGLLVPPEDIAALAAAIERLIDDVALRERLGAAARQVNERFGAEAYLGAWDNVLDGRPSR